MKRTLQTLRTLAVIVGLCVSTRAFGAFDAPDPLPPVADPGVFRIVDPSYQVSGYTVPPAQVSERVPTPEPAAQYAAVAMPAPAPAACEQCLAPTRAWF